MNKKEGTREMQSEFLQRLKTLLKIPPARLGSKVESVGCACVAISGQLCQLAPAD